MATLARWQRTIADNAGNVLPNASIEVRREVPGQPLVPLFSDRDGLVPINNPFNADADGFVAFHAAGGVYQITATSGAFSRTWRYVGIGAAAEFDAVGDTLVQQVVINAVGTFAERDAFDDEPGGFVYLSTDGDGAGFTGPVLFFKQSATTADWSDPVPFDSTGFIQIGSGAVPRIMQDKVREVQVSVQDFGAVGDGVTDDSAAIQAAADAVAALGGGSVFLPPTGAAYVVGTGLVLGNSVRLAGAGVRTFPGATASVAVWTTWGSWLKSLDMVNPTVLLSGHGSGVVGVNFIRDQVIPGGGAYSPTLFPYEMKVNATFFTIDDVLTVATSHDIWIDYTEPSGGGTYSRITNFFSGGLVRGIKFDRVNDTMHVHNVHHRGLFYASTPSLVDYIKTNKIDWDVGYLDNLLATGIEFFMSTAMRFTDQTCLGNTHSAFNITFDNVQFNLVRCAMQVAADDTTVTGVMNNVVLQSFSDGIVQSSDTLLQLGSDNLDLDIHNLRVNDAGGVIAAIGGGASGRLGIHGFTCLGYSSVAPFGQAGFALGGGEARLNLHNVDKFVRIGAAGSRIAGGGRVSDQMEFYLRDRGADIGVTLTGAGNWIAASNSIRTSPMESGKVQARLIGTINVDVAAGGGTFAVRMSNFPEITATGIDGATTGLKNVDSNWVDITSAEIAVLGFMQAAGTAAIELGVSDISLLLR